MAVYTEVSFDEARDFLQTLQLGTLQTDDATQPAQIAVKQSARLTLGQIHYLDHPRLGVIIQVKRFTPPEATVATTL